MRTSYILKTNKLLSEQQLEKIKIDIIEAYEKSLKENIVFVVPSDIELYKLKWRRYVRVI